MPKYYEMPSQVGRVHNLVTHSKTEVLGTLVQCATDGKGQPIIIFEDGSQVHWTWSELIVIASSLKESKER